MTARNIVVGQRVPEAKAERARQFRREMTPAERVLWNAIRAKRLAGLHFRRQQVIVDFYCHAAALVVEVDGEIHGDQAGYDVERDRILQAHGIRVLRVTNDDVLRRCRDVLRRITLEVQRPPLPPDLDFLEQRRRQARRSRK